MRRSRPDPAANSERTGSFHLVNSQRLAMLFPASTERQKVLECTHKSVEKCHYTYVAQFKPSQEEVCDENFEKSCQITFKQQAYNETVRKCCRPTSKVCNGEGSEEMQDGLRVLLHHQVRGEAAWQVCRGHRRLLLELLGLENRLLSMVAEHAQEAGGGQAQGQSGHPVPHPCGSPAGQCFPWSAGKQAQEEHEAARERTADAEEQTAAVASCSGNPGTEP